MRAEAIQYLKRAGYDFKPAESPDLWTYLESHFYGRPKLGTKFNALPAEAVSELIAKGEDALLEDLVRVHKKTGKLAAVSHVLDMPYIVGIDSLARLPRGKKGEVLALIDQPGTAAERVIHVLPTREQDLPATRQATVKGGVYADGHTVGFFDLSPGAHAGDEDETRIYLATPDEIAALVKDMETNADEIVLVSEKECEGMVGRAIRVLGI